MSANGALEHGAPAPLGAQVADNGINFALHAPSAERVELCLFDPASHAQIRRVELPARTSGIWHGFLPGTKAGLLYGYRVHGPYAPEQGLRFNANKLLIDPYARALAGTFAWHEAVFGYDTRDPAGDLSYDAQDSAPYVPKCRVASPLAPRERPPRPCIPWRDTVVYELHARGYTIRHPDVPEPLRGKIAALAQSAVIDHLRRLGVTTIELLPIAAFLSERALMRRGLSNYWGYNPIAFLAPHRAYLCADDAGEIAAVVDRLHEAGIEVVLDVVFNHTAEGDEYGPTLSLRGIDNRAYYRLDGECPRRYRDFSGCGNTLDGTQPAAVALIHAALRYWAMEIGVDGFRFDLAAALGRDANGAFDAQAPLWRTLRADMDLASLKLIVEPWDMAAVERGRFGAPFVEWNDRYRDGVRRFWRGDAGTVAELATRFAGSSDVFGQRTPTAGINFVTAHDGLTLADLVACGARQDAANGAAAGPAQDPEVLIERQRRARSLLATLLLSRGVPMLLAGDELSRTQHGNDNAYCQDNATSWLDWTALRDADRDRTDFVHQLTNLRRHLGVLREECFWTGQRHELSDIRDIAWLDADGSEMRDADWHDASRCALAILATEHIGREVGARIFLALNVGDATVAMRLPELPDDDWLCVLDCDADEAPRTLHAGGARVAVHPGCLCAFVPGTTPNLGVPRDLSVHAERAGAHAIYEDNADQRRLAPAATLQRLLAHLHPREREPPTSPARTPPPCWMHPDLTGSARHWLLSVQCYGLSSKQSWGIGDFADLGRVAEIAAAAGASGVVLSPLHAPRLSAPDRASPYSPSSRFALNPLLISLPQLDEDERSPAYAQFLEYPATRAAIGHVREASSVDYTAVARLKLAALRARYAEFRERHLDGAVSATGERFRCFRRDHASIMPYAIFEALDARFGGNPSAWPQEFRNPRGTAVQAFAREQACEVEFFVYLQWIACAQWDSAVAQARAADLSMGFVTDLALGADRDGAEAWQWPDLVVDDFELGAPPDAFAPHGQAWGLPPWHPQRLADAGCQPFADLLDAVMRGAGAIRIDHVMGLMRQFWVPRGESAARGAYVDFPFQALLERLAQASHKHRCTIIGEDLGNVPRNLRERLAAANVLGYRIVYFERDADGTCTAPQAYPHASVAAVTTHDLPTLKGFEPVLDIAEREQRGASVTATYRLRRERAAAVAALRRALREYGLGDGGSDFAAAAHRFLAATNSALAIVQIEDVAGMPRQANLPGTADAAPNWRQRLPVTLEDLAGDPRMRTIAGIFARRSAAPAHAPARGPAEPLSPYPD
jgi:glycogen operon protein